jgi:Ni2+-binding GTPase involved in maturation of urease and hydrogenase
MKACIMAGPPSAGKTAVIFHAARHLQASGTRVAAVKFDTRSSLDPEKYAAVLGIPAIGGISGYLCPDHYFISNMEEAMEWGRSRGAEYLFIETAGLCLRCAPHIKGVLAVTVVDSLGGLQAPQKMGPMLALADIVVLTKGDMVSQAEREVIAFGILAANPHARVCPVNGLLGAGSLHLVKEMRRSPELGDVAGTTLRHDMPAAICSYCTGEKRIGRRYQSGSVEKLRPETKKEAAPC